MNIIKMWKFLKDFMKFSDFKSGAEFAFACNYLKEHENFLPVMNLDYLQDHCPDLESFNGKFGHCQISQLPLVAFGHLSALAKDVVPTNFSKFVDSYLALHKDNYVFDFISFVNSHEDQDDYKNFEECDDDDEDFDWIDHHNCDDCNNCKDREECDLSASLSKKLEDILYAELASMDLKEIVTACKTDDKKKVEDELVHHFFEAIEDKVRFHLRELFVKPTSSEKEESEDSKESEESTAKNDDGETYTDCDLALSGN